jgi:hypothetical protein
MLSVSACLSFEWEYEEKNRILSPDQMVEALIVEGNGGATTSFVYWVYIVPKGLKFEKDAAAFKPEGAVFSGDHLADFKVTWKEPNQLEIGYKQARIYRFSNYWHYWNPAKPEEYVKYVVETKLAPATEGSALSEEDRYLK